MSGVLVDRALLERLAEHAESLSHADTTHEQRNAAAVDATALRAALALPAQAAATEGKLEAAEEPFTFSGGTVPIPVLRDPVTGERFFLPAVTQVQYNLTHHFAPAQAAADAAEQEGIEAALGGSVGTHNPYYFLEGKEAQCEAWARGNARVWALVGEHAKRAADAATGLMGKPYVYQGITRERHGEQVTLLRQEGRNVYYLSKTGHVFQESERLFHKCFRALADALEVQG